MLFSEIYGHDNIKKHLTQSVHNGRIAHAQLFVGPEGSGTLPMAIAYAQYLLCKNTDGENNAGDAACNLKFNNLSHPDLHFAFPVSTTEKIKSRPVSDFFLKEWRALIKEQPYCNLFDLHRKMGTEKKQSQIGVDEAQEIIKKLSLKSYEGGYKVMIIWMAEKMNIACSNKLLKLIEEPPSRTVIILICEQEDQLISTIKSRCQIVHFSSLPEDVIKNALIKNYSLEASIAAKIANQSNGNYNKAADLVYQDSEDLQFEEWFIFWIRSAFKAKRNKTVIHDLISWSDAIAKTGRETQKQFLHFCLEFFRQAMLLNYNSKQLVYLEPKSVDFDLNKFAPFVHEGNILEINKEVNEAIYHIERNGNSKIILTDLSIKLTRLLHKKSK